MAGPAIVHQFDSTTVVNPGLVARVDAVGNLLIDCSTVRDTGITSLAAGVATAAGPESELDPVTLRVIGGAFNAVAHEMAQTAMRMSFSSIIRESEDLGAGLFDAQGEELCESDTTPLQAGPLPVEHPRDPRAHARDRARDRGRRRLHPQPPVPRRLAQPRRR